MRHLFAFLALTMAMACGGTDETSIPQASRAPGIERSQEQDIEIGPGVFAPIAEPEDAPDLAGFSSDEEFSEYCVRTPDYPPCSGLGQLRQAYRQHQYHGVGDDARACYTTRSSAVEGLCTLPNTKAIHLKPFFFGPDTLGYADYSDEQLSYVSYAEFNWVLEEMYNAILWWNGRAGFSISTASGSQQLYINMANPALGGSSAGSGGLVGGYQNRVTNALPYIAPNGEREARLRSASVGHFELNPTKIIDAVLACTFGSTFDFEGRVRRYAFAMATHEFLHTMGFSHFWTGIMAPAVSCAYLGAAPDVAAFEAALNLYSATNPGIAIWDDVGLEEEHPNGAP